MKNVFLGEYVKQRRLDLGLTQEQLCDGICEPMTLSRLENGKQTPSRNRINALLQRLGRNRQISRRIKKHLWLSNRSWARDVHSFGILHSWGALAGKSCSAQASSIWLIAGAFRRTQSK